MNSTNLTFAERVNARFRLTDAVVWGALLGIALGLMGVSMPGRADAATGVDYSTAQWNTPHQGCRTVAKWGDYRSNKTMAGDGERDEQGFTLVTFERSIAEKCGPNRLIWNRVTNGKTYREADYADGSKPWPAPRYPMDCANTIESSSSKVVDYMRDGRRIHFRITKRVIACGGPVHVQQVIKKYLD